MITPYSGRQSKSSSRATPVGAIVAADSMPGRLPGDRRPEAVPSSLNTSAAKRGSSMLVVLAKPTTLRPVARSMAALKLARIACWYCALTCVTVSCLPFSIRNFSLGSSSTSSRTTIT